MATARPAPPPSRPPARTGEPRISTRGAVAVFLGALLVTSIGLYLFRQGAFTVATTPGPLNQTVTVEQPDYRVTVPGTWFERATTGSLFDAVYSVPDQEQLNVGIVDFVDASLSDATARDQHLALASDMVASAIGTSPILVERSMVTIRHHPLRVDTYDVTNASGNVTRVREYLMVGPDRAVIVTTYGTRDAVERHLDAVAEVARTAKLK
jgi:hypothetical protein